MKNKFNLISVFLILIVLLSSSVYAQLFGIQTSGLGIVMINAFIIAALLFILQAFLVPKGSEGQKTGVYIGILIASIVAAWFIGNTYIWNFGSLGLFFNVKVIVNTTLLSAFFYFIMQFGSESWKTISGRTGGLILIILFSAFLAMQFTYTDDYPNGKFIWNTDTMKDFRDYLFGDEGILTAEDDRIFVFIGASVLFAWLFGMFIKGETVGKKLNYALAIIIAANMASGENPISTNTLIHIGELIVGLALYKGMESSFGSVGDKRPMMIVAIAGLFTHYIAYIIFEEDAIFNGMPFNLGWGIPKLIGMIIAVILLFSFIGMGFKGEKEKKGMFNQIKTDGLRLIQNKATKFFRLMGGIKKIKENITARDPTPEGEVPYILRELRVELEILMNYMLRLEVYNGKIKSVSNGAELASYIKNNVTTDTDPLDAQKRFRKYRIGPKIKYDEKTNKFDLELIDPKEHLPGWNEFRYPLFLLFEKFNEKLETSGFFKEQTDKEKGDRKETDIKKYELYVKQIISKFESQITKKFWAYYRKLGGNKVIQGLSHDILDQYLLYGKYKHTYHFASEDATYSEYSWKVIEDDGVYREVKIDKKVKDVNREIGRMGQIDEEQILYYEVDNDGFLIDDLNEVQVERKEKNIRKIDRDKIIFQYHPFYKVTDWLKSEWKFFIQDIRDGRFHDFSYSSDDYGALHKINELDYSKIEWGGKTSRSRPTFDREALKDSGKVTYLGKKYYYDTSKDHIGIYHKNSYPGLSTLGISNYMISLIINCVKEQKDKDENIDRYTFDSGIETYDESERAKELFTRRPQEKKK